MNALRHGLTGRTIVMPNEDMTAYRAFCKELFDSLAPATPVENQLAQTFCDTQWRLNRIRSIEDNLFALGHFESASDIDVEHPEVHAALTAARVFRDDSKSFLNLSLYEQRLQRTLEKSLRQLHELQTERKARRQAALDAAVALRNLHKMQGRPYAPEPDLEQTQFVFSTAEIELEARRQLRLADAEHARKCAYDLNRYRDFPSRLVA